MILLRSTKNAFIVQSQSRILDYLFMAPIRTPPPPEKFFRGEIIQGEWRNFHRALALFQAGVEFHVLPYVLVCFLVEFDLLFAFGLLSWRILGCTFLFIYVHEHDRLCFPMLTVETAVFNFWLHLLTKFQSRQKRSVLSGRILFGIGGRVLWAAWGARSTRVNLNHATEM